MAGNFTVMDDSEARKFAVDVRDENVLLAAAAGSGKTYTLVQRIIGRLYDLPEGKHIDSFLVVTFTRDAAAELRGRLAKRIDEEIEKLMAEGNTVMAERFSAEKIYLKKAQICTIDAFCSDVVKKHFNVIEIEPNFAVDDVRVSEITDMAMEEVLEEYYGNKGTEEYPILREIVEAFCSFKDDRKFREILKDIICFSENFAQPEKWIDGLSEKYNVDNGVQNTFWYRYIEDKTIEMLDVILEHIDACLEKFDRGEIYADEKYRVKFREAFESDRNYFTAVKNKFEDDRENNSGTALFEEIEFPKIYTWPTLRNVGEETKHTSDYLKIQRGTKSAKRGYYPFYNEFIKKFINDEKIHEPSEKRRKFENGIIAQRKYIELISKIATKIAEKASEIRKRYRVYSFNNVAHMCLSILSDEKGGQSMVAKEYSDKYSEVYIDEYQDTSELQEKILTLVSKIPEGGSNLFMVGDVKQSIYRFRNAEPTYFMEKYENYKNDPSLGNLKLLTKNFRSREGIIKAVNDVFVPLMTKKVGGVDYADGHALCFGSKNYDNVPLPEGEDGLAELVSIGRFAKEKDGEASELTLDEEGCFVAEKIVSFMESGYTVAREGKKAALGFNDIFVLADKNSKCETIAATLRYFGIPVSLTDRSALVDALEVRDVLNYLRVMDNPLCDIPLCAMLKSPFMEFSDNDFAKIKSLEKDFEQEAGKKHGKSFYECLKFVAENCENNGDAFSLRIKSAVEKIEKFRILPKIENTSSFVWRIINDNDYYAKCDELGKGNLRLLLEMSKKHDSGSDSGLYAFLREMDVLIEAEAKATSALAPAYTELGADANRVCIATVHKSKGLEKPVVFLCGTEKEKSDSDVFKKNKELGIGGKFVYRDENGKKTREQSAPFTVIRDVNASDEFSEKIRKFYVALTRAAEKLIVTVPESKVITASKDNPGELYDRQHRPFVTDFARITAKSYYDMLLPALFKSNGVENWKRENYYPDMEMLSGNSLKDRVRALNVQENGSKNGLSDFTAVVENNDYAAQFAGVAMDLAEVQRPAKLSVSAIKKIAEEDGTGLDNAGESKVQRIKKFATIYDGGKAVESKKKLSAAELGTLMHKCVQKICERRNEIKFFEDGSEAELFAEAFISKLAGENIISEEEAGQAEADMLVPFLCSQEFKRIKEAEKIYTEKAFTFLSEPERYFDGSFEEKRGKKILKKEKGIAVQGVIDIYYIINNKIYLIDFKSDRKNQDEGNSLIPSYKVQLMCYVDALETITGKRVESAKLYFLRTGKNLDLE